MNRTANLRQGLCILMLALTAIYIYLNTTKLDIFSRQWANITQGEQAPRARITLAGRTLWEQPLMSTGYYGGDARRQIHYLMLDQTLMQKLFNAQKDIDVLLGDSESVKPQFDRQHHIIRADLPLHRIYFLPEHQVDVLAMIMLAESRDSQNIIACQPESLCRTVRVSSREWGPVEGPYLKTEAYNKRRGLPRGRWLPGPQTTLSVRSARQQSVTMLLNIYGLLPDQQISVAGQALRRMESPRMAAGLVKTESWDLYPHSLVLQLDLQAGENELVLHYSKSVEQAGDNGYQLGALLSGIKIKAAR